MKHIKLIIVVVLLAPVCILALLNILFCGTDTVYISSDRKWSERQMIYRHREFKDIVASFENYKIRCNAPDVELERLRSKPEWIVLNTWIDNRTEAEKQVPLSTSSLEVTFGFSNPPIDSAACYKNT